jgi:hypothetical protein
VRLIVLDAQGRVVRTLASGAHRPGAHRVTWDGRIGSAPAPAGLYFVRLDSRGVTRVRRIAVTR